MFSAQQNGSSSSGPQNGTTMTWSYDRFGNRWSQTGASPQSQSYTGSNNRIDGATYDPAGNLLVALGNQYLYDDENRVVSSTLILGGTVNYSYNAEGQRIRKAVGSSVEEYVYDSAGHQLAAMQPNTAVTRVELYASARHLATYDAASNATYFIHGDWQGTERLRSSVSGASYETCTNLPFGDAQQCSGGADISPMHFTGKPRDTETNLDYFGARYYNSTMARWMSPDWADKPTDVPYAEFGNPQSLNLYGYVTDNPVSRQDGDGHATEAPETTAAPSGGDSSGTAPQVAANLDASGANEAQRQSAPAQQQGSLEDRIITGISGAANVYVGADKAAASVVAAMTTPATTAGGAIAAIYEGYQAASQMAAGVTQLGGAITGKTAEANQKADDITIHSSVVAYTTLKITKDRQMAVQAAGFEGIASSSLTKTILKGAANMVDTVMNWFSMMPAPSH